MQGNFFVFLIFGIMLNYILFIKFISRAEIMQKGHYLQFDCQDCQQPVRFSVFELERRHDLLICPHCGQKYHLEDENLKRQLRKFEMLCRQIVDSEEILANTAVGIDVGDRHVKVPYKILLTRLNSTLDLHIGNRPVSIEFRFEPLHDTPKNTRIDFETAAAAAISINQPIETSNVTFLVQKE